ncbi:DUF7266 family protein [Natrarchaeobius oligotrophus]|uniref:Flagellin n=1 Tax=Natrarchaeobius chitinivorans TaxID=1679083 RepID=A0A3N6MXD5_NATCH|nr:hypothetical protein [Natrarchaeobius chitinivorans]RQG99676.1 hypothetical protein EA472_13550 [Natrarchaeobius chitinivorans]
MRGDPVTTDRALSTAVTHVLTMGITTILVAGLLMSSGTLIEVQSDRSAEQSLETIGERLAGEIADVDRLGGDGDAVNVTASHPETVAGSTYRIELEERSACAGDPLLDGNADCLRLTANGADVEVIVPIASESDLEYGSTATGGTIEIEHDGTAIGIR